MTDNETANELLIGRADVDDIDAILAISNSDVDAVVNAVRVSSDSLRCPSRESASRYDG